MLAYPIRGGAAERRMSINLFAIVFATGLAGMLGAPWWGAAAGACVIALVLLNEDRREQLVGGDAARWEIAQTMSSLTISAVAGPVAFAAGRVTGVVWGV